MTRSVLLAAAVVVAVSSPTLAEKLTVQDCANWSDFAALQMRMRQSGVPYRDALAAVHATPSERWEKDLANDIVLGAYNAPLEQTDRLAEIAAIKFAELHYTTCMKHIEN